MAAQGLLPRTTTAISDVINGIMPQVATGKQIEEKYDCPVCHDTGYVDYRDKNGYMVTERCRVCDKARKNRVQRILEKAQLPFHTMHVRPHQQTFDYIRDFNVNKPIWALFSGKAGSGKTTEAAWLAYELITKKGVITRFYGGYDLVIDLIATRNRQADHERILEEMNDSDLVVIDDLFKSLPAPNSFRYADYMEACYETIWSRYNVRKPLVITTQYSVEALVKIDAALAGRILELSRGRLISYGQNSKNWRIAQRPDERTFNQ